MGEIQILSELQECDTLVMRTQHALDGLPEAAQILECRAQRKELKIKQDQVIELVDEIEAKTDKLQLEEERVITKINELQAVSDTSHDHRIIAKVNRDMKGQIKRQGSLAKEQEDLLERQIKADNIYNQISEMLHRLDHKEDKLTTSFKDKGTKMKATIAKATARRNELADQLDERILRRYEKLRAEKGGIGLAHLEGEVCSACRSTLQEGQLRRLAAGPALSECPNCHRLLVVCDENQEH